MRCLVEYRKQFLVSKVLEDKPDAISDDDVKIQGLVTNIVIDETDFDFVLSTEMEQYDEH